MDHHRRRHPMQDIQLTSCSSQQHGSASAAAANGDSRRWEMCPSLYLAAYKGGVQEVMVHLLQTRHGAAQGARQVDGIVQHRRRQCDLLEVSAEGNTVVHVAAEEGHGELIQELYHGFIKDKTFLSRRNSALDTPLHCAARAGHVDAVTVLLRLSRDCGENIMGCQNATGDTALHLAARHGHGAVVEALVAARASGSELNKAGVSPLYLAVMSRSEEAVRAITTTSRDASSVGPSSQNALHAAVFQSLDMVRLLLQWRPELAGQVDCNGSTPLHFASSDGNHSVVSAILDAAPPGTVYMKDDADGLSALHVAARMGHAGVVDLLIGAFPDAAELRDGHGETFLHAAAREKRSSVVALAVSKNLMPRGLFNSRDAGGNTPLHLAVAAGAPRVVEALLWKGEVRTDILNDDGHTPLDLASQSTSCLFIMLSLVVTLVAFRAQLRPQRQDHLNPWSRRDIERWIEKTSDNLAVVAVLIATVAFAAGFNMPGGYASDGNANLQHSFTFKWFLFLDTVAMAASVVAVILLVYGKASRSAGSWKSFVMALHCMWASLVSLIGAFYLALTAVTEVKSVFFGFLAVNVCLWVLVFSIGRWVELAASPRTIWRFWGWSRSEGGQRAHAIKRQYPYAGHSVVINLFLFKLINIMAFLGMATTVYFETRALLEKSLR